jgi:hypothetical protein
MLGSVVTDKLIQAFPEIMNVKFTAGMELKLDEIEEQHLDWIKLLQDFYGPFHETVDGALEKIEHAGGAPARTNASSAASRWSTASARTASSSVARLPRMRRHPAGRSSRASRRSAKSASTNAPTAAAR